VYREEGAAKFMSGIHPRFMFNTVNGVLFLLIYEQFVNNPQHDLHNIKQ
jgi:hypothetical protein